MTPPSSLDDTRTDSGAVDVTRLSFSVKLVISIFCALATVVLPIILSVSSVKSDVRDMATRQEMRDELNRQNWDSLATQLKLQSAKTELLQIDVNDLKLTLAGDGRYTKKGR